MSRVVDAALALQAILPQPGSRGYDHWFGRLEVDALRAALEEQAKPQCVECANGILMCNSVSRFCVEQLKANAFERDLGRLMNALAALTDPEHKLCGVLPGPERDELQVVYDEIAHNLGANL